MSIADVIAPNFLVSGESRPVWTTIAGFAAPPLSTNIKWHRLGNVVHCQFFATPLNVAGAGASATVTLPVPRTTPFTGNTGLNGSGIILGSNPMNSGALYFLETLGGTTATLTTLSAADPAATLLGSFAYRLG